MTTPAADFIHRLFPGADVEIRHDQYSNRYFVKLTTKEGQNYMRAVDPSKVDVEDWLVWFCGEADAYFKAVAYFEEHPCPPS